MVHMLFVFMMGLCVNFPLSLVMLFRYCGRARVAQGEILSCKFGEFSVPPIINCDIQVVYCLRKT